MEWYVNLKVRTKILSAFMVMIFIAGLTGIVGFKYVRDINGLLVDLYSDKFVPTVAVNEANQQAILHNRGLYRLVSEFDNAVMDRQKADMASKESAVIKHIETFRKAALTGTEKELLKKFDASWASYLAASRKTIPLSYAGKNTEAIQILTGEVQTAFDDVAKSLNELVKINEEHARKGFEESKGIVKTISYVLILLIAGAIVAGILMALFISGLISRPIRELAAQAEGIAAGDLTASIISLSRDETGQLANAFNKMTDQLREAIGKMTGVSTTLASAASQLYANTENLVTGSEQMASQADAVSTASEEMAATTTDIAHNCLNAAEGAQHAKELAANGAGSVRETVDLMHGIAEQVNRSAATVAMLGTRSDQIGEIIGTIEDIADQTNLLALNAAIEAARAGEQGRGFAVVADEVRALAERTTKATKEIAQMIRTIQNETRDAVTAMQQGVQGVEKGKDGAARSGEALQHIVDQINAVSVQVSQIATASEEQNATTSEISCNIHQISQVIRASAKETQDSAEAANGLIRLAEDMQNIVRQFKVS